MADSTYSNSLEQRFKGAVQFLKSTPGKHSKNLFQLPWYLVIGTEKSGRSSLLANCGLQYLLAKKNSKNNNHKTEYIDWWVSSEASYLDCHSRFMLQTKNKQTRKNWLHLLQLIKQEKPQGIESVIITLSMEQLATQGRSKQRTVFTNICRRITEIQRNIQDYLPIYIVITQCDTLAGFTDFFYLFNQEEKRQAFGIDFNKKHLNTERISTEQKIIDHFDIEYDDLLDNLHKRLVTYLHREISIDKRALIKDFPVQMESMKKQLAMLMHNIAKYCNNNPSLDFKGLYFTSAKPQAGSLDRVITPLSNAFSLQPIQHDHIRKEIDAYFCYDLFHSIIKPRAIKQPKIKKEKSITKQPLPWVSYSATAIAVSCLVIAGTYWTHKFTTDVEKINATQMAISEYLTIENQHLPQSPEKMIKALNTLNMVANNLQHFYHSSIGLLQHSKQLALANKAYTTYTTGIEKLLSQQFTQVINEQIALGDKQNANILYGALMGYLMLDDPNNANPEYIQKWLLSRWGKDLKNPADTQDLQKHLNNLFNDPDREYNLDEKLVQNARDALNKTNKTDLSFAILQNNPNFMTDTYDIKLPEAGAFGRLLATKVDTIHIPKIYTVDEFIHTYDVAIPEALAQANHGNWVLGITNQLSRVSNQDLSKLRAKYMSTYVNLWGGIVNHLDLVHVTSLDQASQLIDAITEPDSPLTELLLEIDRQTHITYHKLPTPISVKFDRLHSSIGYVTKPNGNFHQDLQLLQSVISNITSADNPQKAAFQTAKIRMLVNGKGDPLATILRQEKVQPNPIKSWLNDITLNSWALILQQASVYINTVWQQNVLPFYNTKLASHYPFDLNSQTDVSMTDFNLFFAPNGIFNQFFSDFLISFIDTSQGDWRWKTLDKLTLPLAENTLQTIQQAAIIQTLYFPTDQNQMAVSFLIKPVKFTPNLKETILHIEQQDYSFTPNDLHAQSITWPQNMTNQTNHNINISMLSKNNTQGTITQNGPWAWYRILQQAGIQTTAEPKAITVNFANNGLAVQYALVSTKTPNPFASHALQEFICPKSLL